MNADFRVDGKVIETERLVLRPFRETDLEDFFEYASVDGVGQMAGWLPHENREKTLTILEKFIEEDKTFAITLKELNGKVIGSLGVEFYNMEDELSEFFPYRGRSIGFTIGRDYWGRGLMPEAVKAVTDYLFGECDMDFLLCGHYDFNGRSARVQEKVGFKPYRKLVMDTRFGTKEPGRLNILLNPAKDVKLVFSHPETLVSTEISSL